MWWRRNPYEDEFHSRIEQLGRKNSRPFNKWFEGEERVFFPFDPEHILDFSGDDEDVIDALEEADYEVHDYKGGYCRRPDSNKQTRIGKVLNRLRRNDLKELKEKHQRGELYNLRRAIKSVNKSHDELMKQFSASPYRDASNIAEFSVVISQNPHDIAKMSTGRTWESCMTLGSGSMHSSVFKEVASGGLVAYLIRANDLNIERPLSRIHIRRFMGIPGRGATISIAKAEKSVYGEDVEGFKEAVDDWIEENQETIPTGAYQLQGGSYSDTYKSKTLQIGGSWELPKQPDELLRVYHGEGLEDIPYKKWTVTINEMIAYRAHYNEDDEEQTEFDFLSESDAQDFIYGHELNQYDDWRIDEDSHILEAGESKYWTLEDENEEYVNEPLEIEEKLIDDRPKLQSRAASKIVNTRKGVYPKEIIADIKNKYPGLSKTILTKYPELFTEEELKKLSKYDFVKFVKALPKDQRDPHIAQVTEQFTEIVTDPATFLPFCLVCQQPVNPKTEPTFKCPIIPILHHSSCSEVCEIMQAEDDKRNSIRGKAHSDYEWAHNAIDDVMSNYMEFRTRPFLKKSVSVPENIIQLLVTVPERTYMSGRTAMRFRSRIVHLFHMTGSDTPTVQDFYEALLPHWRYEFKPLSEEEAKRPDFMRRDRIIDMNVLGSALANLGENGCRFIPFIRSRLEQLEADFGPQIFDPNIEIHPESFVPRKETTYSYSKKDAWEFVLRTTEKYLYILDSIESGLGRSSKYRYHSW